MAPSIAMGVRGVRRSRPGGPLPIAVDAHTAARAPREVLVLARAHGLTGCDGACLELAARSGLPLTTRDAGLARGAEALGLTLLTRRAG